MSINTHPYQKHLTTQIWPVTRKPGSRRNIKDSSALPVSSSIFQPYSSDKPPPPSLPSPRKSTHHLDPFAPLQTDDMTCYMLQHDARCVLSLALAPLHTCGDRSHFHVRQHTPLSTFSSANSPLLHLHPLRLHPLLSAYYNLHLLDFSSATLILFCNLLRLLYLHHIFWTCFLI